MSVIQQEYCRHQGEDEQEDSGQGLDLCSDVVGVQIPQVYVVGDELAEYDREVVPNHTVDEHQTCPDHAEDPVGHRRD